MRRNILKPRRAELLSVDLAALPPVSKDVADHRQPGAAHSAIDGPASLQRLGRKARPRAGWRSTIVRQTTFQRLQAIQTSTRDPAIDLSFLSDACIQLALELGRDRIVKRALESMSPLGDPPST